LEELGEGVDGDGFRVWRSHGEGFGGVRKKGIEGGSDEAVKIEECAVCYVITKRYSSGYAVQRWG
jgi:hypothetical protein